MKKIYGVSVTLGCCSLVGNAQAEEFTGQYLATGNISTQTRLMPSLNNRLTANYAPSAIKGNIYLRLEHYTENSYHTDDGDMTRERKFEGQVNFNYPLFEKLKVTVGALRHENYTFRDNYNWAVAGLSWTGDVAKNISLTTVLLAEKRNGGGRVFYDLSGILEQHCSEKTSVFAAAHIYENLGEADLMPTHKREFEIGVNYVISKRYFAGISYFYHQQVDNPSDRFSFMKIKFGVNF